MRFLIRQMVCHIGDLCMTLPGCKHLHDLGHEVLVACPERYRSLFDAVSYASWTREEDARPDRTLECSFGSVFEAPRVRDIVYLRHPELRPAMGREPVFDRECDGDYGLPPGYVLFAPFAYSVPTPPLEWFYHVIGNRLGGLEGVYGLAECEVPGARTPFIRASSLGHLPGLIRRAREFFTVNTGVDVIAAGVRASYHHVYTPYVEGRCNYEAPNQVVLHGL